MAAQPHSRSVVFRQSLAQLLRVLPIAGLLAGASALLFLVGWRGAGLAPLLAGALGLLFFGPALLILLGALVRPNYLVVEIEGLRFRLYNIEASIPWGESRSVSAGAGWPSLTFHDCEAAARHIQIRGLGLLGWVLEIPTRVVSLLIRRPLANVYPATNRQLVNGFHANEQMFGFHYGLPTSLLDGSTSAMVQTMRRAARSGGSEGRARQSSAEPPS